MLFPKNPVWGKGRIHSFKKGGTKDIELVRILHGRSSQIHVGYLSLFYYYGIMGSFFYFMFLVLLSRKLFVDAKETGRWAAFMGWCMFLISNMVLVVFDIFSMGIILALFYNEYHHQKLNLS